MSSSALVNGSKTQLLFRNRKRLASAEFLFCYLLRTLNLPVRCAHAIWAGFTSERRFVALSVPLMNWVAKLDEDSDLSRTGEWIEFETEEEIGVVSASFSYERPLSSALFSYERPLNAVPSQCVIQRFYASIDLSGYAGQRSKDIALHYSTYSDLVAVTTGIADWMIKLKRTMLWYQAVNSFMTILLQDHQPETGGWLFSIVRTYWHSRPKHNGKPPPTVGVISTGPLEPGAVPVHRAPMPFFVVGPEKIVLKIPDPSIANCSLEKWRFKITYLRDDELNGRPFFMRTHSYRMSELASLPASERPWCREQTELGDFEDWVDKAIDVTDYLVRTARMRKSE